MAVEIESGSLRARLDNHMVWEVLAAHEDVKSDFLEQLERVTAVVRDGYRPQCGDPVCFVGQEVARFLGMSVVRMDNPAGMEGVVY